MESYQVGGGVISGGTRSLWGLEMFVSPSRAVLEPPWPHRGTKGRDSITKQHLEACSKSMPLQKNSLKIYPLPLSPLPVSPRRSSR